MGSGLPGAPVTNLQAFNYLNTSLLRAATYGRGLWQIPLLTAGVPQAAATLTPATLSFASQAVNTVGSSQAVTVTNTGTLIFTVANVTADLNFVQQNNCTEPLAPGGTCTIQVRFAPATTGALDGVLTVFGNLPTGQITASLSGTGLAAGNIVLSPTSLDFGNSLVGVPVASRNITISNTGGINVGLSRRRSRAISRSAPTLAVHPSRQIPAAPFPSRSTRQLRAAGPASFPSAMRRERRLCSFPATDRPRQPRSFPAPA